MTLAYAIDAKDLRLDFGGLRALDGLSFRVPTGSVFGFLGPNGSGKTTTIRILLGLLRPSGGQAHVLGLDVSTDSNQVRERSGVLLEHHGLDERLSALENLELWARIWRMSPRQRAERVKELLGCIGLWERRLDQVGQWSHGMKKRLALARAVIPHPELVLLDEPTAGLDVASAVAVRRDLASIAGTSGTTVFLSTHNMAEAEQVCDLVAVIRSGKLVAVGTPRALRTLSAKPRIEIIGRGFTAELAGRIRAQPHVVGATIYDTRMSIDLDETIDPAPLVAMLVGFGASVEEVHREVPSLEEVFLRLTEEEETEGTGQ